ncbi:MAG TPA: hypothetical protein VFO39_19450 [Candidatus Sulfotelmatobacter sp.]|nr:hypothetical protein [Candidatus Sulfotelmatobacter sp.]
MNFVSQLLRAISFVPALVNGIEAMFAEKSGAEKKDAAMSFLENALAVTECVASREITDPQKFREGIGLVINGVVECLNASAWSKAPVQLPAMPQTNS